MTPSPMSPLPPSSPHVSFPLSSFQPVNPTQGAYTNQLHQPTPIHPTFDSNQLPPPTFAPGFLPTTPYLQNQITPRELWLHPELS